MMTSKEENKTKGMLTKKDLDRMAWRSMTYDYCWHYERGGNMGYSTMIGGVLKKIYKGQPEKYKEALKRNLEFFNITAMFAPFVGGVAASMEEQNAKTEGFDTGTISAIKTALMGPLAGIGDSIFLGTLRVIAIGIGVSLLSQGNVVGAFPYALIFNIPNVLSRFLSARLGYRLGVDFLTKIQNSGIMEIVMTAAGILGMMAIGGMNYSMVYTSLILPIGTGESATTLQAITDGIMPGLAPLGFTWLCYWLMKKGINIIVLLVLIILLCIACVALGIMG